MIPELQKLIQFQINEQKYQHLSLSISLSHLSNQTGILFIVDKTAYSDLINGF